MAVTGIVTSDWVSQDNDPVIWKSCARKRTWRTRHRALQVARYMNSTVNRGNPVPIEPYHCKECRWFHVGHRMFKGKVA